MSTAAIMCWGCRSLKTLSDRAGRGHELTVFRAIRKARTGDNSCHDFKLMDCPCTMRTMVSACRFCACPD